MENAVPIVTQAPGAQPLQIQPGLLAQVRDSKGTELSMCFMGSHFHVLFSSWGLSFLWGPSVVEFRDLGNCIWVCSFL